MQPVVQTGMMGLDANAQMRSLEKRSAAEQAGYVARQFEGIFLKEYLKDALKPLTNSSLGEDAPGKDIYQSMIVDTVADGIEKGGGLGMANAIQLQLQGLGAKPASGNAHHNA
jgi:Rod binding domain-containing protein